MAQPSIRAHATQIVTERQLQIERDRKAAAERTIQNHVYPRSVALLMASADRRDVEGALPKSIINLARPPGLPTRNVLLASRSKLLVAGKETAAIDLQLALSTFDVGAVRETRLFLHRAIGRVTADGGPRPATADSGVGRRTRPSRVALKAMVAEFEFHLQFANIASRITAAAVGREWLAAVAEKDLIPSLLYVIEYVDGILEMQDLRMECLKNLIRLTDTCEPFADSHLHRLSLLQLADLHARQEGYATAREIFERVAAGDFANGT